MQLSGEIRLDTRICPSSINAKPQALLKPSATESMSSGWTTWATCLSAAAGAFGAVARTAQPGEAALTTAAPPSINPSAASVAVLPGASGSNGSVLVPLHLKNDIAQPGDTSPLKTHHREALIRTLFDALAVNTTPKPLHPSIQVGWTECWPQAALHRECRHLGDLQRLDWAAEEPRTNGEA